MTVITAGKLILPELCLHVKPETHRSLNYCWLFLKLFPGQERGRVRFVAGKAQQETVSGSQEGEISMERDFEKGNKGCKKYVHLQVPGCNV